MLVFEALMKASSLGLVVSVNLRSASELLSKVKLWAEAAKQASKGKLDYSAAADKVVFSNGARVLSLPATSDSLRGFTCNTICAIDEAAFCPNLEEILQAISPTLSRTPSAQLVLTSTPAGKNGEFYKLWENAQNDNAWYT